MQQTYQQLEEGLWDMIKSAGRFALDAASEVLLLKPLWRLLKGRITLTQARYIAEEAGSEIEQYVVRALKDDPESFEVKRDGDYYHVQFLFEIKAKPVVRKVIKDLDLEQYQDTMKPEDFQRIVEVAIYEVTKERGFRGFLLNHLLHHQKRLLEREVGRLHAKTIRKYKDSFLKDPADLVNSIEGMAKGAYEVEVESKKKRDGTQVFVSFDLPYLKKHIKESTKMNRLRQLTEGSIEWNEVSIFNPRADYREAEAELAENLAFMLVDIFKRFNTMFGIEDMSKYTEDTRLFEKCAHQTLASLTASFSNSRGAIYARSKGRGVEVEAIVEFDQMRVISEAISALKLSPDSDGKSMLKEALDDAFSEGEEDSSFRKAVLASLLRAKEDKFEDSVRPQVEEWAAMNLDSPDYDRVWRSMAQNIRIADLDVDMNASEVTVELFMPGDVRESRGIDNLQLALESTREPTKDRLVEALTSPEADVLEEGWLSAGLKVAASTVAGVVAVKKVIMPAMRYFGNKRLAKDAAKEASNVIEAFVYSPFADRKHYIGHNINPSGTKFFVDFIGELKVDEVVDKMAEVLELDEDADRRKLTEVAIMAIEKTAEDKEVQKTVNKIIEKEHRKAMKETEEAYEKYIEYAEEVAKDMQPNADTKGVYKDFDRAWKSGGAGAYVEKKGNKLRIKYTKMLKPLN